MTMGHLPQFNTSAVVKPPGRGTCQDSCIFAYVAAVVS